MLSYPFLVTAPLQTLPFSSYNEFAVGEPFTVESQFAPGVNGLADKRLRYDSFENYVGGAYQQSGMNCYNA